MKQLILFFGLLIPIFCLAQSKPELDTSVFGRWPEVRHALLSPNRNYALYTIHNIPVGSNTLVIKSLIAQREDKVAGVENAIFSANGQFAIFKRNDSLCIYELQRSIGLWIYPIVNYTLLGDSSKCGIVYTSGPNGSIAHYMDLDTKNEIVFNDTKEFLSTRDGKGFFLVTQSLKKYRTTFSKIKIDDLSRDTIWSGIDTAENVTLENISSDLAGEQIAFSVRSREGFSLWLYNARSQLSHYLAGSRDLTPEPGVIDIKPIAFTKDKKRLIISIVREKNKIVDSGRARVNIWRYKDIFLQSAQLRSVENFAPYTQMRRTAVFDLDSNKLITLSSEGEEIVLFDEELDSVVVVAKWSPNNLTERNWNLDSRNRFYLLSLNTGKKQKIEHYFIGCSPSGNMLYGYDRQYKYLFVFDIRSGQLSNISFRFPASVRQNEDYDKPEPKTSGLEVAGWLAGDSGMIVYDKFDIWVVNLYGPKGLSNLTRGYGRSHHVQLRLIGNHKNQGVFDQSDIYLMTGFNKISKENGFFSLSPGGSGKVRQLFMGPYHFDVPFDGVDTSWLVLNTKLSYLVLKSNALHSPNLYLTTNFSKFAPLSSVYPEAKFNWMTSEVISWSADSQSRLYGVLYKPENFDARKKYPVIINYYETLSQRANEYKPPSFSTDNINIPWFVSRGYIVFTPDIKYRVGHPGQSATISVVTGTKYVMKNSWVDAKRIALQGHSWGGYETNCIVTSTNMFCAALSASAVSDVISDYGSILQTGGTKQFFYELDQSRIGATPWKKPALYFENSPILKADKIKTPLLLMSNAGDGVVAYSQGIELFTALRRLNRKVWMLQYEDEGHSVFGNAAVDYTMRMTQFFDHYCKGLPAPKWMTCGIPALMRDCDNGFELNDVGFEP